MHDLLIDLAAARGIPVAHSEYRAKSLDGFREKATRKRYANPLSEMTDLAGIRLVLYYLEDVDDVARIIRDQFAVDEGNSVDKAEAADPDRFGYQSVHFVARLPTSRTTLPEWGEFKNLAFEIQVRTAVQHAWATIDHKLRYKSATEAPRALRRQLFRLSALLELADTEFSEVRRRSGEVTAALERDVQGGDYSVELDLPSFEAYLRKTDAVARWASIGEDAGFLHVPEEPDTSEPEPGTSERDALVSQVLRTLHDTGCRSIHDLDRLLSSAEEWAPPALRALVGVSVAKGFAPLAVGIDVIGIVAELAAGDNAAQTVHLSSLQHVLRGAVLELAKTNPASSGLGAG